MEREMLEAYASTRVFEIGGGRMGRDGGDEMTRLD